MVRTNLDPGGERRFQICWPTLGQWNQIGAVGCSLAKGVAIRTEHACIITALSQESEPLGSADRLKRRRYCDR